jgi:hypothetical protein
MAILVTSVQQNTSHLINSSEILTSVIRIQTVRSGEILTLINQASLYSVIFFLQ